MPAAAHAHETGASSPASIGADLLNESARPTPPGEGADRRWIRIWPEASHLVTAAAPDAAVPPSTRSETPASPVQTGRQGSPAGHNGPLSRSGRPVSPRRAGA